MLRWNSRSQRVARAILVLFRNRTVLPRLTHGNVFYFLSQTDRRPLEDDSQRVLVATEGNGTDEGHRGGMRQAGGDRGGIP